MTKATVRRILNVVSIRNATTFHRAPFTVLPFSFRLCGIVELKLVMIEIEDTGRLGVEGPSILEGLVEEMGRKGHLKASL